MSQLINWLIKVNKSKCQKSFEKFGEGKCNSSFRGICPFSVTNDAPVLDLW